jgi:hypothetical protein
VRRAGVEAAAASLLGTSMESERPDVMRAASVAVAPTKSRRRCRY